jgi:hypothetical protein
MSDDIDVEKQKWVNELTLEIKELFSNYNVVLKGLNGIVSFFVSERDFWFRIGSEVKERSLQIPNDGYVFNLGNYYRACVDAINLIETQLNNFPDKSKFDYGWMNIVNQVLRNPQSYGNNLEAVYSKSLVGQFIVDMYQQNVKIGDGAYKYFRKHGLNINIHDELVGFLLAYEFDKHKEADAEEREKHGKLSFESVINACEQKSHDIKDAFEKQKVEFVEWKTKFINQHAGWQTTIKNEINQFVDLKKKELGDLDAAYREKLKLEAAVTYWGNRATQYRKKGYWWLRGLSAIIFSMIIILIAILYNLPTAFYHKLWAGEPEAIKGLIILATIISLMVYLARVFAKMTFSSFHIETDAEEREQLTLIYLALVKEGKVSEKELGIILQSLFSRVDTGILKDDGSPTMPTLGSVVDKIHGRIN